MPKESKGELISGLVVILVFLFVIIPTLEEALNHAFPNSSMGFSPLIPLIKIALAVIAAVFFLKLFQR